MAAASSPATAEHGESGKWLIAIAVVLAAALEVLDTTIINVSLPHMQGSFSASVDEITWILTSYLVANGIMIPMTGWIAARYGRKRYFLTSVLVFIAASAICGLTTSLDEMVVFRLVQGAAGAAMIPLSQSILMETFPPSEQQLAMAVWGLGLMVAPIMGPTLGGWITDNLSWRWNFYINVPIGLAAFAMVSWFVHDPAYLRQRGARSGKVDYLGIIYLALGLGLLQLVLDRGQRLDWFASKWIWYGSIISGLSLILLPFHELKAKDPILDIRILFKPIFALAVVITIIRSFVLYGTGVLLPLFLQDFMAYDAWKAGLVLAPRALGTMASMLFVGQIARRGADTRLALGLGFILMALGLWQMSEWNLSLSMWEAIAPGIILGAGMGLTFPIVSAISISVVPRERMGYAASLYNMMRNTGGAIGISYLTDLLVTREQIHQAHLVNNVTVFKAWSLSHVAARAPGASHFAPLMAQVMSGQKQGLDMVYNSVQAQAAILSFNDIYRLLAFVTALMIPTFIFFKQTQVKGGQTAH
ncbi:MAG: DHA2 family efflux MFS transporter permease subunit [Candidatus Binataceae bacterium]